MSASVIFTSLTKTFGINCQIFFVTLLFALPLGLIISFGSMSRFAPLRAIVKTFVWIIRGTPLMLQIIVIFYGPGLLWDGDLLPRLTAVCASSKLPRTAMTLTLSPSVVTICLRCVRLTPPSG